MYRPLPERILSATIRAVFGQKQTIRNSQRRPESNSFHQYLVWYCSWIFNGPYVLPTRFARTFYRDFLEVTARISGDCASRFRPRLWLMIDRAEVYFSTEAREYLNAVYSRAVGWERLSFILVCSLIQSKLTWIFLLGTSQISWPWDPSRFCPGSRQRVTA